jgi:Zn-dependent metalloprotease
MSAPKLGSLLILAAILWVSSAFSAQAAPILDPAQPADSALLRQLSQAAGSDLRIARHAETGKLRFVAMESKQPLWQSNSLAAATPEQISRTFLSAYGQLFGLRGQGRELALTQQERLSGREFVRFQQVYQGIPVIGGEIVVQTSQRRAVMSANGEIMPDLQLSVQPGMAAAAAAQTARTAIAKRYRLDRSGLQSSTPQLWIYNPALLGGPGLRISRLVWRIEVRAAAASRPIRELVLVDAHTGAIALHFNQIADAKQRYVCDGENVIDSDDDQDNNCTPAQYVRIEGQGPIGNSDVDRAYDYAGVTYDYFFNNFGRDSLDGKGLPLISLVRYCPDAADCPLANANWDGYQMTYGAGFAAADDVVGHELAHGFTEFSSHLFYYYQSGAINESLSDVFGELIDQADGLGLSNDAPNVRWLMGEDLPAEFGVIRNMRDPGALPPGVSSPSFSPSPDRMTSFNYDGGSSDNGGVHTNSGVNNKAAYLMTDGGSFNGQTITGLGAAKVGAIYYTLELAFLTSASDYQDLFEGLPAACAVLADAGAYGVSEDDCKQVRKAVLATEMHITPPAAPVPEAPVCATGQTSQDVFYDDLENPASGIWASSAAQGENAWFYPASANPFGLDVTYATSGNQNFWGYDQGGQLEPTVPADYSIAMTRNVSVPANAHLHFRHAFEFEADFTEAYDGGVVEYSTNAGNTWNDAGPLFSENGYVDLIDSNSSNPLRGRQVFSGISQGYYSSRLDLSALAGQNVRFRFRIGTDPFADAYGWFIDDIRIYTCSAAPPVASLQASAITVAEDGGAVTIQLRLSGVTDQTVSVPFSIGGSANQNVDYRLLSRGFIIPAGGASGRAVIEITNDSVEEPEETIILSLGTPVNATLGAGAQAAVTIRANDAKVFRYLPLISKGGG